MAEYGSQLERIVTPYIIALAASDAMDAREGEPEDEPQAYVGRFGDLTISVDYRGEEGLVVRAGDVKLYQGYGGGIGEAEYVATSFRPGGWVFDVVKWGRVELLKCEDENLRLALETARRKSEAFAPLPDLTHPTHQSEERREA